MEGKTLHAYYHSAKGEENIYTQTRIDSENTHGTGCTLSAAIATLLAKDYALKEAISAAQDYVQQAIMAAKDIQIGRGKGSLNHFFDPQVMQIING